MTETNAQHIVHYVDDNADIRFIAEFSLSLDKSLDVEISDSAAVALKCMQERRPDLLLLDVMMPDMDGPELLQRMREMPDLQSIPVVFVTARTQPAEVRKFIELGARGVIEKPFDPMNIAERVKAFLD